MKDKSIKILALDLDGTVFTNEKIITQATKNAIHRAIEQGVIVVPTTGRPLKGLPPEFLEMPGVEYALTSNGAAIWRLKSREKLVNLPLSTADTLRAMDLMKPFDCMVDVYLDGNVYASPESLENAERFAPPEMLEYVRKTRIPVPNLRGWIEEKQLCAEKVTMFFNQPAQQREAMALAKTQAWLTPSNSAPKNLELNAAGVDKGMGLRKMAEHFGVDISQVMACGDGDNDIAMLKAVGWGVAMGNADAEVKAAADAVTATNEEDGVAKAIEAYILKQS